MSNIDTTLNAAVNQIADRCLLVHISFRYWTGKATDKRVATDVENNESAATGTARVTKSLIDDRYTKDILREAGRLRGLVSSYTVPWSASGGRIMPSDKLVKFMDAYSKYEASFRAAVDRLLNDYPMLKRKAQVSLGTMYDPDLYPSNQALADKFDVRLNITAVPVDNDFRFDIPDELRDTLRDNLNKSVTSSVGEIRQDLIDRCLQPLQKLEERLRQGEIKRFNTSLIHNVTNMADEAESLNIFGDAGIKKAVSQMRQAVSGLSVEAMKESKDARREQADKLKHAQKVANAANPFANLL